MRNIIIILTVMLLLDASMAFAELTKEDLREIESIVQRSEARLGAQLREYVDLKFAAQKAEMGGIKTEIEGLDKRLQMLTAIFIGLIALIGVAVGVSPRSS